MNHASILPALRGVRECERSPHEIPVAKLKKNINKR
jgi:hypothetical protein